ncbi:hypothetical protein GXM_06181 [Nostoc sphaeroides CCNUC1]|uniref:Uncharacterized protein n=1 Tax=Nostoc sphaeroides CCNUC1 TaxID=2653204 RepID=A0A5P8W7E1_9NOSO|nr:hypothetical protein GXM_06181 [Nostoc sphaeroides CCNUC1]
MRKRCGAIAIASLRDFQEINYSNKGTTETQRTQREEE